MNTSEINAAIDDAVETLMGRYIMASNTAADAKEFSRGWITAQLMMAIRELDNKQQVSFVECMKDSALTIKV